MGGNMSLLRPVSRRTALIGLGAAGAALALPSLRGAPPAAAATPDTVGVWDAPFQGPFPLVGIHATLLHTGKVLLVDKTGAYLWDPSGSGHVRVDPPNILYCSGHTVLANGDVFFAGGVDQRGARGPRWTYEFDVARTRWVRGPDLRRGRYYPTVCLLGDGRAVITSGKLEDGQTLNDDVEVYSNRTLQLVGTRRFRMYPHMWLLPNGNVLIADAAANCVILNPANWTWSTQGRMNGKRVASAGVLVPGGPTGSTRVFVTGGHQSNSHPAHGSTESYDAANPSVGWHVQAPLPQGRSHMNLVLLPDRTMLGVAGTQNEVAQRQTVLYNPTLNTWTGMASQTEERGYHSTALLLPDGRVLSAGDNFAPGGGSKLELYSPPYLFKGTRPTVTAAPSNVTWGAAFAVDTPNVVARAVLIRPSSVTHTNDMNQRHIELSFSTRAGGITATAPPSRYVAPPGWYMLFLLNSTGVPSVAHWLKIGP